MTTRVIMRFKGAGKVHEFWTGYGWSEEYPDAEIFGTAHRAIKACAKVPGNAAVVVNYGMMDQETEWAA